MKEGAAKVSPRAVNNGLHGNLVELVFYSL